MDYNCIFCKIINGQIPGSFVYEDDFVVAFPDINPMAAKHYLVVPKAHIPCADDIFEDNSIYVAKCFEAIAKIAGTCGLEEGYRVINNCREFGGQTVMHLHFHLLGGEKLPEVLV